MRTSEWIQCGFAIILASAAWIRPLTARRRWIITLLAAFAVCAVAVARVSVHVLDPLQVSIIRDWLSVALMLVPYWQIGQFFMGPNEKIQEWLAEPDRRWLERLAPVARTFSTRVRLSMEVAYMSCYPLVPLGLAVLYTAGLRCYMNAVLIFFSKYKSAVDLHRRPNNDEGPFEVLTAELDDDLAYSTRFNERMRCIDIRN